MPQFIAAAAIGAATVTAITAATVGFATLAAAGSFFATAFLTSVAVAAVGSVLGTERKTTACRRYEGARPDGASTICTEKISIWQG